MIFDKLNQIKYEIPKKCDNIIQKKERTYKEIFSDPRTIK
jgi:hypothetical protein